MPMTPFNIRNATILLTGGSGMVGKNIVEKAAEHQVSIITPNSAEVNLRDYNQCFQFVKSVKPSVIIHSAGVVGGIQANIKDPVNFLVANVDMGRNIVLAAAEVGVPKFLNLGSSCMYPRNATNPLKEEQILGGELEPTNEGYAIAKIFVQRLCSYINNTNSNLDYKTILPCNLYGRFDKFDPSNSHMLPSIISKLHHAIQNDESEVEIWGNGKARREFMYAGDFADAVFFVLDKFDEVPDVMNVGLGQDFAVNQYYEVAAQVMSYKGKFTHDLTKPVGMARKLVCSEKINKLGWSPKVSLREGIKNTWEFYMKEKLP